MLSEQDMFTKFFDDGCHGQATSKKVIDQFIIDPNEGLLKVDIDES